MTHTLYSRAWWLVAGALIVAFLARGPLYLSVFPPLEGWDEYQHLAYVEHLDEAGTIPVVAAETRVPRTLLPFVLTVPQPSPGLDQVKQWGALSYADYWGSPTRFTRTAGTPSGSPRLYQAQQPPLAYLLALPLWHTLKATHALEAIYAIRVLNLLLVAAGLAVLAGALPRLVPSFAPRVAAFALVCLHPLFFENVARVANDGLAVATGVAGISLLVLADARTLLTRGTLAAVCIAVSVWSKQTSLTLIPPLVVGLLLMGWAEGVPARRLLKVTTVVIGVFSVLVAPLWLWNYQHYGTLLTTQDSIELHARGSAVSALVTAAVTVPWSSVTAWVLVPGTPWVGGWSFLPVQETLAALYRWYWSVLLAAAGIGAVVAGVRRAASRADTGLAVCALVVICSALGIGYYTVLSHAVFGRPMTTPWYFMTAQPFLLVLVVRGLHALHERLAITAAAALAVLFVAIDIHGTWVQMPAFYANTSKTALQWSRLAEIHPAMLNTHLRWWFLATQLGALGLTAGALTHAARNGKISR